MNFDVNIYNEGWVIPGFIAYMPENDYHSHESISKSGLDRIDLSPAHYKHAPPREPTADMNIGSAIHCATLEPDLFPKRYVVLDCKDRGQKEYKDAAKEVGKEYVLLRHEERHALAARDSLLKNPTVARLANTPNWRELSAFATDPVTGVTVRCRYDLMCDGGIAADLKKSRSVMPRSFGKSCGTYRYHVQVALYSDIYEWITGETLNEFWLIAVEDKPPYTPVDYRLDDLSIEAGRREYRKNLNTYAACLEAGEWPLFEPETHLISVPDWALDELDDLEIE